MDNMFNLDDLSNVLSELNSSNIEKSEEILNSAMTDEMKASQKRYEEYIKKHEG